MKKLLNTTKKILGASLLAVFAAGIASAQNDFPAADTSAAPVTDTGSTANEGALGNTVTPVARPEAREVIHDRGGSSIGQYDPSGNSLPVERSPYEHIGASYYPPRKPKQKSTVREYRDYGGTVFRQPDSGSGMPATAVPQDDSYVSNQPVAPNGTGQNSFAPADSTATGTNTGWGNTQEQKPADRAGSKKGQPTPANKANAPADTTRQERIKGWDY